MPIINAVKASLIVRNDSSENWQAKNPVLLQGELGAETDTLLIKIGDGVTPFNNLPYLNNNIPKPTEYKVGNVPVFGQNGTIVDSGFAPGGGGTIIPPATEETIGGVLSSLENNKVRVNERGEMEVNNISV